MGRRSRRLLNRATPLCVPAWLYSYGMGTRCRRPGQAGNIRPPNAAFEGCFSTFVKTIFSIVLGGQRSPQNSAHHEHQQFWPRVSEETIINKVVFVGLGTLPRGGRHFFAQPTNASRPEPLMLMMRGWVGIEASLLLGDPGGEHQQHQQVLGAAGAGGV